MSSERANMTQPPIPLSLQVTDGELISGSVVVRAGGLSAPQFHTSIVHLQRESAVVVYRRGEQSKVDGREYCPHVTVWVLRWQGVIRQSRRNPVRQEVNSQTQIESASSVIVNFTHFILITI